MATATGIWNHAQAAAHPLPDTRPTPLAGPANGNNGSDPSDSSSDSATISANDFLTLLVTEMQNQDPTADTDPNEYIDQLVQVNSLEQLIDINQNLSTALGGSSGGSSGVSATGQAGTSTSAAAPAATNSSSHKPGNSGHAQSADSAPIPGGPASIRASLANKFAPGNLSVPQAKPSAHGVAESLSGHKH